MWPQIYPFVEHPLGHIHASDPMSRIEQGKECLKDEQSTRMHTKYMTKGLKTISNQNTNINKHQETSINTDEQQVFTKKRAFWKRTYVFICHLANGLAGT